MTTDPQGRPIRHGPYPELTWSAVIVGWIIGALIALSIGYAALILGFSIEGSELAAILGWGILRGLMGRTSIVENNINQTIASAVNGASAGMMFSVPALFILASQNPEKYGEVTEFSKVLMVLACITGGVLGLAFIIPLRKQMIDFNRLAYPGGVATAAILKSPGAGMRKAVLLMLGIVISGAFYIFATYKFGDHPQINAGKDYLGTPSFLNLTFFLSLMTVGVGFISGKGGLVFGYGGFICYFFLAPLLGYSAKPTVQEILEPPPTGVVAAADGEVIKKVVDELRGSHPDLAEQLAAATKYEQLLQLAEGAKSENEDESRAAEQTLAQILTGQTLLDSDLASLSLLVSDVLRERVSQQVGRELEDDLQIRPEDVPEDVWAIRELRKDFEAALLPEQTEKALAVLAAADDLSAPELREATTFNEIHRRIRQSSLTTKEKETVLAAIDPQSVYDNIPEELRTELFRPTGIGMLIGAAIGGIIAAFPLIISAIQSMRRASRDKSSVGTGASEEMPIGLLYAAVILGSIAMVVIAEFSVPDMTLARAAMMAVLGIVWIWIAGVIVSECLGRTNWSPLSGMTLIAVTILLFIASGMSDEQTIIASVIVGAAVCVAIAQAGDMMLDLKAGYLVGASPKKQQIGQYLGTWLGPILIIGLIFILHNQYTLGSSVLPAPQGAALASMINGIVGGDVPTWRYTAGSGLGALLAFSGLGGIGVQIGLGFYMPFDIVLTYTIGCAGRIIIEKIAGYDWVENAGIPIAAGLIVGEALVGLGKALITAVQAMTQAGGAA